MRSFLNQLESDRVTKLCSAADSDEKLFWKLLKGQKSSSQMSAFLVNGSLITDINEIRNMWADHFEALRTLSESATYDNGFSAQVSAHVRETFEACLDDPGGILNEPLTNDEIASVCSKLKPGVCGFPFRLRTHSLCWSSSLESPFHIVSRILLPIFCPKEC